MSDGTHKCCGRSWIDGCACPPEPEYPGVRFDVALRKNISKRRKFNRRDGVMLFIGIYIGAMGTVILAYFWERLL